MAQEQELPPSQFVDNDEIFTKIAEQVARQLFSINNLTMTGDAVKWAGLELIKLLIYFALRAATPIAVASMDALFEVAENTHDQRAELLASVLRNVFGADVDMSDISRVNESGSGGAVAGKVVQTMLDALTGGSTSIAPSPDPANRYVNTVLSQTLESWITGATVEVLSAVIPGIDRIQSLGDVGNLVAASLGIGDSSSRVLRPYIDTLVVEPLRRHIDKTYRPALLSEALAVQQILRRRGDTEVWREELRVRGYSEEKIDALINAQRKFFSAGDVRTFVERRHWTNDQGIAHLQDQGYDHDAAEDALRLEGLRRIDQLEANEATAILSAYVNRNIDRATFLGLLRDAVTVPSERALLEELGNVRRGVNIKGLSAGEARRLAQKHILAVADFRRALEREGYDDEAVLLLELELRADMEADATLEALRAAALAERAAETAARDAAAKARKADVEQQRALARRGPVSRLERAVVRGLIPLSRLEEVLAADYDSDTVAILVADVEQQRLDYLDDQAARDAAKQRAAVNRIGLGDLEAAVMENVLTPDDYRRALELRGITGRDADVLVATLRAQKADRDAAKRAREDAQTAAARRSIDLNRFEQLVRRGARTIAQYDALLQSLDRDDTARAEILELLSLKIADDAQARALRAAAPTAPPAKGLTLEQTRRAVVLELLPINAFEQFLLDAGYTADAQIVLLNELRDDVAEADAARTRRGESAGVSDAWALPLSTIRRAARLGMVSPQVYVDRLVEAGWPNQDIDIELNLLLTEIADVQAARTARDAAPAPAAAEDLTLAQLAVAVKRGFKSLADYQAVAVQAGLSQDAVETQLRVLADELEETKAAKVRREALSGELDAQKVNLAELEQAVRAGQLTLERFIGTLIDKGLAPADAELLAALLGDELAGGRDTAP